jgi:nucleotide-binding universal stress UspA family protein
LAIPDIKAPSASHGELAPGQILSKARALRLDRLLLPLDGSDESEQSLPYAAIIAKRLGGEINLFHCLQPMHPVQVGRLGQLPYPDAQHDRGSLLATAYLQEVKKGLKAHGLNARWNVVTGEAAPLISYRAATGYFGVTFLAAHTLPRVVRGIQANVTTDLWKLTAGPLFLFNQAHIKLNGSPPPHPETIFIPVSDDATFQAALPVASTLSSALNSRLVLLLNTPAMKESDSPASTETVTPQQNAAQVIADELVDQGCHAEVENVSGGVIAIARRQLEERGSWVIVGSHMRSGLSRLLRGNQGDNFLRQCRGPLIVVPDASVAKSRDKSIRKKMAPAEGVVSRR